MKIVIPNYPAPFTFETTLGRFTICAVDFIGTVDQANYKLPLASSFNAIHTDELKKPLQLTPLSYFNEIVAKHAAGIEVWDLVEDDERWAPILTALKACAAVKVIE